MANESTCIFCVLRDRSLFIAKGGWGGAGNFRGDHLSFGRTKGGSVVTENPKGGITGKDSEGEPLKFAWKMKTWRAGGDREKHQKLLGGQITSVK